MKPRTVRLLVSGHCFIFPPATSEKEKAVALAEHVPVTATPWRKGTQVPWLPKDPITGIASLWHHQSAIDIRHH